MPILIRNLTKNKVAGSYLKKIGERVLEMLRRGKAEVSLILVDKKRIKYLNRIYRRKDKITDVLSFSYKKTDGDRFISPKKDDILGEIVICVTRAEEQAKEKGEGIKKEMAALMTHGILHLVGYDHEQVHDAEEMEKKEKEFEMLLYL